MNLRVVNKIIHNHATHAYNTMADEIKKDTAGRMDENEIEVISEFLNVPEKDLRLYEDEKYDILELALGKKYENIRKDFIKGLLIKNEAMKSSQWFFQELVDYVEKWDFEDILKFKEKYKEKIVETKKIVEAVFRKYVPYFHESLKSGILKRYEEFVYDDLMGAPDVTARRILTNVFWDFRILIFDAIGLLDFLYIYRMYDAFQSKNDDFGFLESPSLKKDLTDKSSNEPILVIYRGLKEGVEKCKESMNINDPFEDILKSIFSIMEKYLRYNMYLVIGQCTDLGKLSNDVREIKEQLRALDDLIDRFMISMNGKEEEKEEEGNFISNMKNISSVHYEYLIVFFHMVYYNQTSLSVKQTYNVFEKSDLLKSIDALIKTSDVLLEDESDDILPNGWQITIKFIKEIQNLYV